MFLSSQVLLCQAIVFAIWSWLNGRFWMMALGMGASIGNPLNAHPNTEIRNESAKYIYTHWSFVKHVLNSFLLSTCSWPSFDGTLTLWPRNETLTSSQTWLEVVFVFILCQWFVDYLAYLWACTEYTPKDFLVMRWHHVVTVGLMFISFWLGYIPIGAEILYLHEVTDIFMSTLQMMKLQSSPYLVPVFLLNIVSWAYWRIFSFGSLIISLYHATPSPSYLTGLGEFSLLCLWLMHIYWLGLMLSIAVRLTTTPASKLASDYDGRNKK